MALFRWIKHIFSHTETDQHIRELYAQLESYINYIDREIDIFKRNRYKPYLETNEKTRSHYLMDRIFLTFNKIKNVSNNVTNDYERHKTAKFKLTGNDDLERLVDVLGRLITILHKVSEEIVKLNDLSISVVDIELDNLYRDLEKSIEEFNQLYKNYYSIIKGLEDLIKGIVSNSYVFKVKRDDGKISEILICDYYTKKELKVLEDLPFCDFKDFTTRSNLGLFLHQDSSLGKVKHYNIFYKKKRNFHVVPKHERRLLRKTLAKMAA